MREGNCYSELRAWRTPWYQVHRGRHTSLEPQAACPIHSLVSKGESPMGTKHVLSKVTESFVSQRVEDEVEAAQELLRT